MSQRAVKHIFGLQALWPPYGVAYCGDGDILELTDGGNGDKMVALDRLLARALDTIGAQLVDLEDVVLVVPAGPGPFTGLRSVAAYAQGLGAASPNVMFSTPTIFDLYYDNMPKGVVDIYTPHHRRAMFCGVCEWQNEGVLVYGVSEVVMDEVCPPYWCDSEKGERGQLPVVTPTLCVQYAQRFQQYTRDIALQYYKN